MAFGPQLWNALEFLLHRLQSRNPMNSNCPTDSSLEGNNITVRMIPRLYKLYLAVAVAKVDACSIQHSEEELQQCLKLGVQATSSAAKLQL